MLRHSHAWIELHDLDIIFFVRCLFTWNIKLTSDPFHKTVCVLRSNISAMHRVLWCNIFLWESNACLQLLCWIIIWDLMSMHIRYPTTFSYNLILVHICLVYGNVLKRMSNMFFHDIHVQYIGMSNLCKTEECFVGNNVVYQLTLKYKLPTSIVTTTSDIIWYNLYLWHLYGAPNTTE